jgi:hypothetical protein
MMSAYEHLTEAASLATLLALSGDAHPSVLFDGVKMSYTIATLKKEKAAHDTFASKLYRWLVAEHPHLFKTISYQKTPECASQHQKIGSPIHLSIASKVASKSGSIGHHIVSGNGSRILYHRIVRHFVKSFVEAPFFSNERDGQKRSEDYKELHFDTGIHASVVRAILISSTFYLYFLDLSDSYHLAET